MKRPQGGRAGARSLRESIQDVLASARVGPRVFLPFLLIAAVGCGKNDTINWDSTPPPSHWITSTGGGNNSLPPMQATHNFAATAEFGGVIYVIGGGGGSACGT